MNSSIVQSPNQAFGVANKTAQPRGVTGGVNNTLGTNLDANLETILEKNQKPALLSPSGSGKLSPPGLTGDWPSAECRLENSAASCVPTLVDVG